MWPIKKHKPEQAREIAKREVRRQRITSVIETTLSNHGIPPESRLTRTTVHYVLQELELENEQETKDG